MTTPSEVLAPTITPELKEARLSVLIPFGQMLSGQLRRITRVEGVPETSEDTLPSEPSSVTMHAE
jgi:hypothetical protein